jgi:hypothetical protein
MASRMKAMNPPISGQNMARTIKVGSESCVAGAGLLT